MRSCIILCLLALAMIGRTQSVFNEGTWYKLAVLEDGIYKLDQDFLSKTLKINVSNIDPQTLKLYGKGGGMLPQANSEFRYSDPPEIALFASGETDGKMDAGDYFLFYGQSPHRVRYDSLGNISREHHLYSDTTFYYLTFGGNTGKRMAEVANATTTGTIHTTFPDYIYHEVDEHNILESGREWFGEGFGSGQGFATELTFSYTVPGIKSTVNIYSALIGNSEGDCSFESYFNNAFLGKTEIDSIPTDPNNPFAKYSNRGNLNLVNYQVENLTTSDLAFKLKFNKSTTPLITSRAYLDYFILSFDRDLKLYDTHTFFRGLASGGPQTFQISNSGASAQIWNLTDPISPTVQQAKTVSNTLQFTSSFSGVQEFVILSGNAFPAPISLGSVNNQSLKDNSLVDGVIITYPAFKKQAERLANFHRTHDQLRVAVVTTKEIYQEFSSGIQDISAIRDYLRFVWQTGGQLKYACLFGDASFDYKDRERKNTNFVPVYESKDSFHALYSYSSDDFIGFLEDNEGEWIETRSGDHTMEIGVGRLPVKSETEAEDLVDKIIRYATSENTFGKWRTQVVYLADDGDLNRHMIDVEDLSLQLSKTNLEYEVKRLYLDDFNQIDETNNRYTSPDMQLAFKNQIKKGAFIVDYLGHGSPTILMEEQVITEQLVEDLDNRQKLPMIVTATCDFGKYDDPSVVSGAEHFLLNPNGGAIALLTTTRPVQSNTNFALNMAFHEAVFQKINGEYPRLGDVLRITKNNSLEGRNNRNFALLGDPMLRLNYPHGTISFDQLESKKDTLKALEIVSLTGSIRNTNAIDEDFNGTATVTVLDIPQERVTKGQENSPFTYQEQTNALFRGEVTVEAGLFTVSFHIPKNTSYKYEKGKILAYAFDKDRLTDAAGASANFVLGGTATLTTDQTAPTLTLYLNDDSFKSGGTVGSSSLLIAKVFDENGINLSTNGFEQGVFLTVNDEEPIFINDFYTADLDSYQHGTVAYPLQDLEPGRYTATIKIRDSYNNASTAQVQFKVSDEPKIRLYNLANYPNPATIYQETRISFEHDREGEDLSIGIVVYDGYGSVVNHWEYLNLECPRLVDDLTWVPTTAGGQPLRSGIYYYKVVVKSALDGASNEAIGRMIIHN